MSVSKLPEWAQQHLDRYIATNGAEGHLYDFTHNGGKPNTPNLLLTTVGRKSGQRITLPLIYGKDRNHYVIVASKGGSPEHPAWYLNLVAKNQVEVQVADKKCHAVARTAQGEERKRLWDLMADVYPPYNDYQQQTSREIPVVVLEPA